MNKTKSDFYTILTSIGIAKFIAARASGNGVNLEKFKLSSKVILPSEEMRNLEEVVYEANIASKSIDEINPNYVHLECYVPSNVGGFEVNAIGIYDSEGDLIAIGNTPRTYKPLLEQGSAKELMIKVVMELSNAEEVILKLEPSVIMASRDYVDKIKLELELKIDSAINELLAKLALKADLNGNNAQVFSVANPSEANHAINKATLDSAINSLNGNLGNQLKNCVLLSGNQSIAGIKTFSVVPVCATNPTANNQLANKSYVDSVGNAKVALNGNQTINGIKTFSANPVCAKEATADNQLINLGTMKKLAPSYVDKNLIKAICEGAYEEELLKAFTLKSNVNYTNNSGKDLLIVTRLCTDSLYYDTHQPYSNVTSNLIIGDKTFEIKKRFAIDHGDAGSTTVGYYNKWDGAIFLVPKNTTYKWVAMFVSVNINLTAKLKAVYF